jgi:hypothetical protein
MPSITDRVRRFMHSPQGRKAEQKAKEMAKDPKNQQKVRRFADRWRHRH